MIKPSRIAGVGAVLFSVVAAGLLVTGCGTNGPQYGPLPPELASTTKVGSSDRFRIGDQVMVTFQATSGEEILLKDHHEAIKEDGTITPPFIGSIVAAGKTPGDVQRELQDKYDKIYRNMTVTIIPADRFYYVTGEVKKPGPEPYLGETDIIKAISAALDFTDFGNKHKVRLTRANGQTQVINVQRILDDPQYDVPVYPGDKIYVPRRLF
jgi:protein involved in polysaccharide export with SLBB domain